MLRWLRWLDDKVMNAGQKDLIVVWDPSIEGHVECESGIKHLWFYDLCLTVSPLQIADTCLVSFSIYNGGPKAIGIGAQGTRLVIAGNGKIEIVEARQLKDDFTGEVLAKTFMVDIGQQVNISADFGTIPPFSEATFAIQAKRIFAPQISFQIPLLGKNVRQILSMFSTPRKKLEDLKILVSGIHKTLLTRRNVIFQYPHHNT